MNTIIKLGKYRHVVDDGALRNILVSTRHNQGVGRKQNYCLGVEKLAEAVVQMTAIHFAMFPSLKNGCFCNYSQN